MRVVLQLLFHMCRGSDGLIGHPPWCCSALKKLGLGRRGHYAVALLLCVVFASPYRMGCVLLRTELRAYTAMPGIRCLSSTVQSLEQGIFSGCAGTECMQRHCASLIYGGPPPLSP
jgi:hypothetical protein